MDYLRQVYRFVRQQQDDVAKVPGASQFTEGYDTAIAEVVHFCEQLAWEEGVDLDSEEGVDASED